MYSAKLFSFLFLIVQVLALPIDFLSLFPSHQQPSHLIKGPGTLPDSASPKLKPTTVPSDSSAISTSTPKDPQQADTQSDWGFMQAWRKRYFGSDDTQENWAEMQSWREKREFDSENTQGDWEEMQGWKREDASFVKESRDLLAEMDPGKISNSNLFKWLGVSMVEKDSFPNYQGLEHEPEKPLFLSQPLIRDSVSQEDPEGFAAGIEETYEENTDKDWSLAGWKRVAKEFVRRDILVEGPMAWY